MKWGREANLWQGLVRSSKEFAISSLNSGLERGTYKVLCQRTQSGDLVRMELKPLYTESSALTTGVDGMGWCSHKILKEKKKWRVGGGKEKRKRTFMLGNVSMNPDHLPVKRISQTFLCFFPVTQARWHIPRRSLSKHKAFTLFSFSSRRKQNAYHEYQPL